MLTCSQCGTHNEVGRKFCKACAARLAITCPSCGFLNAPDSNFCGDCATELAAGGATARASAMPASTDAVGKPAAERRLVSVLFVDLVGFTPFAEERDAEEVRDTLSRYFDLGRQVVARYGGTIEKFIGDALMAVWGAPSAHEDDAERAVRAALELVELVPTVGVGISARAAVVTGEAAVTIGATDQGMVAGDLVNTAARLQSVAAPGSVLVGEATYRATERAIAFEPARAYELKGKEDTVEAYSALRVVAEVGGKNRAESLEAPFVGRDEEMRLLKELYHATGRERRPRLVSVSGPAGIGKSRFGWEFAKYVDGLVESVWWHAGRSPAYGQGVTFWALGEMVRERAGLAETDDEPTTRARIAATVAQLVSDVDEARWIEGSLLVLLGIETERVSSERLFAAWRTFFERIAARGTVVLLFEDLHWADDGLLEFIDHLLEWSRDAPILLLTLARPELLERRPDWGSRPRRFTSIALEPLIRTDMLALLGGLVPGLPATAANQIADRADGMPLYAVETVRMLLADGRLERTDEGVYQPTDDLAHLDVPATLTALISARLDALEPAQRSLVADGAVLGQSFSAEALAAIAGSEPEGLRAPLRSLVRRELLAELRDPRSPERGQYSFVQSLIREVAYATLSRRDRRSRHLAAARYFEALGSEEIAGALAGQLLAAHANSAPGAEADAVAVQARIALRAAAERASQLAAHAQAMALYEQALTVTADPAERAELLERAGVAASNAGQHDRATQRLHEAVAQRRLVRDQLGELGAAVRLGDALVRGYQVDEAIGVLQRTRSDLGDVADTELKSRLGAALARALLLHGDHRASLDMVEGVLVEAEALDLSEVVAEALATRGSALADLGRPYEGIGLMRAALELAEERGHWETAARARQNLLVTLGTRDLGAVTVLARQTLEVAKSLGVATLIVNSVSAAAEGAYWAGDWDWLESEVAEVLQLDLEDLDAAFIRIELIRLAASRRSITAAELSPLDKLESTSDVDAVASALIGRAHVALFSGNFRVAREHALNAAATSRLVMPLAYPYAARGAIWLGDAALARTDLDAYRASNVRGKDIERHCRTFEAGICALEGRTTEALNGYRGALLDWREAGLPVLEVLTAIDMAAVLDPSLPEVQTAADVARELLESLEAQALLARLDEALARKYTPDAVAASADRPSEIPVG